MLFTDSDIIATADLMQIDSEVASVAAASKPAILVEGAGSICEQAWIECGRRLTSAQQLYGSTLVSFGVSSGHQEAVTYTGGEASNQARVRLNQIVASESQYGAATSPLQVWMTYLALANFYRAASARMGKDRLEEKWTRYVKDADFAWNQVRKNGLPVVYQPMEAPGAKHAVNAGIWSAANLSAVAGSGSLQTVQVAVTYYDSSKYVSESSKGNGESGPSQILTFDIPASSVLKVDITSLIPPNGVMPDVGISQGTYTPLNATHWVIFCGALGGPLYWQAAVPIATKTYTFTGDPVFNGAILGLGQVPLRYLTFQNTVGRG